ncbi:NADH dehydrogenase FAD-containing subunit [Murinocardiopsis flavida]|uniref:NADH dehydrogenase FAD-containing subunit n=1 Tax=Murinocardiopsis flavida TaxID=645275 RepID=A0A2P8CSZ9_9ACTN|nr:FAD-dependent oxidoreductase [Murinocardiopsis flavida]PSK88096.1 NADH dehydrogenase FAD-containing subunit [Murinocardiopsis flavida]
MSETVVVVGAGYGGTAVAKALDDVADVVLVEPRDTFVHNIAALRGLVDPDWTDQLFHPYDRLLRRGRVVRDRAVRVDAAGVDLGSGDRIAADYTVLATGASYPFPAKTDTDDSATSKTRIRAAHAELAQAENVLLLGAGPVGLELAGEIKAAWSGKSVTIVDPAAAIVPAYPDEFRAEVRRQLDDLGVELVLGTSLSTNPPSAAGEAAPFTVLTESGREITADIWFRCFGSAPATGYLGDDLAAARRGDGRLDVTLELRLPGQERVFAIGDITAVPEAKRASAAGKHAEVVAANIRALITGDGELAAYRAEGPGIALPLGPKGGASYSAEMGILDAETTSQLKGADLMVGRFAEALTAQDG